MPRPTRRKPLAQFEHGTKIYAPSPGEPRYRVVSTDPVTGQRRRLPCNTETEARTKAREIDARVGSGAAIAPNASAHHSVAQLAARYEADHLVGLSVRFREKQIYVLRRWVLPHLGTLRVTDWNAVDSTRVLNAARQADVSDALIQDIGASMRALVTHARRLRWLTHQSDDPMWMVRYAASASIQGTTAVYVPRDKLPTDQQCADLFTAMEALGQPRWATAMRLKHRSGLRWGELTALQASDLEFEPARIVHVRRAVEQPSRGPASLKIPKNRKTRTSIFPPSLTDELLDLVARTAHERGPSGLLFPGAFGKIIRRTTFHPIWIRAAAEAGWPMRSPLRRTKGYGTVGKGWRWTGAAEWSPHDFRHVAACWMLFDIGLDPAIVADKLGHADPAFTMKRYVGLRGNPDLAASNATIGW